MVVEAEAEASRSLEAPGILNLAYMAKSMPVKYPASKNLKGGRYQRNMTLGSTLVFVFVCFKF